MTANGNGGNYAPLKQIVTDSESDEERSVDRSGLMRPTEGNHVDINSGLDGSRNCSASDMDEYNTNANTADTTLDNVSFLQSDASGKMSTPRRCAFVGSILACVLTVVVFLWGVPCSEEGSCAGNRWQDRTMSWEFPYDEVELSGTVQVVNGAMPNTKNLIFIYRGNHMRQTEKINDNGVILIVGNSGKVGWFTRETRVPTDISCQLLDVNKDGQKDCLISGSEGLLSALNPLSGTYFWFMHKQGRDYNKIVAIDFPIVIKDVDRDKVNDLMAVATVAPYPVHNCLVIVSGSTGSIIGDPIPVDDCISVKLLSDTDSVNITYICKNGTTEAVRVLSYAMLYRKMMKLYQPAYRPNTPPAVARQLATPLQKSIGNTRETFTNGPGKLIVDNSGDCPDNCKVSIKLLLERNGTTSVRWEYSANHVFAMKPSSFAFAKSIRGFVLKL